MLPLVVLETLGEPEPGDAHLHVRPMVATATEAVEAQHREYLELRLVERARRPDVPRQLSATDGE
ncbi:hypothetical protein D3C83_287040 [compost metagenome]